VLGRLNTLTPDEARKLAASLLAKVKLGADPAAERSEAEKAQNVDELLDLFMDSHICPYGRDNRRGGCLGNFMAFNHGVEGSSPSALMPTIRAGI
jgi:hypothetical protein